MEYYVVEVPDEFGDTTLSCPCCRKPAYFHFKTMELITPCPYCGKNIKLREEKENK